MKCFGHARDACNAIYGIGITITYAGESAKLK